MHVPIPGTRVRLIPPDGFRVARHFQGLVDDVRGLTIQVTEVPQPLDVSAQGEPVTVDGHPGRLVRRKQSGGVETVETWMVQFGDPERSVVIGASAPLELAEALDAPLRAMMVSARWSPEAPSPVDDLPYRFTESPPLKVASRMGAVVLLTGSGTVGLTAGAPMMTLGHLPAGNADLATIAVSHLEGLPGLEGVSATAAEEVVLETGEPALELLADALSAGEGLPIRVYQLVTRVGDQEVVAIGRSSLAGFDSAIGAFRAVARSLRAG